MKTLDLLAFDFGASGGRGMLGRFNGKTLTLDQLYRFSNDPVEVGGHLYWDVLRLFWNMQQAILKYVNEEQGDLASIGIDTWGVDYGLLDKNGDLLGNPYHYRDPRAEGMMEEAFGRMPRKEIYERTGIAFENFNTLFQLLAMVTQKPYIMDRADTLLFMPDLLAYFLTGEKMTEFTEASTGQLLDAHTGDWCYELLDVMSIPQNIFTSIQQPGSLRGKIMPSLAQTLGAGEVPVIAVATHDTGSAVAAVPAKGSSHAYLSSGTWSLMGVEVNKPVINSKTFEWNYTNEGGVNGTYTLLKNIMGLWIIQECKREWDRRGEVYSYSEIADLAMTADPFLAFIDPDNDSFYSPGGMPQKVQEFCRNTGQRVPETKAEILRCVFESLAMKYRWSMDKLEEITRGRLDVLHIVGGGVQNEFLNQLTANAINRPVICGPVEATAAGNLMVQAMALGEVANLQEIRQVIRDSFPTENYMPQDTETWDSAYGDYLKIIEG
ncbi:MAG: rhamnulokinase [Clostridiales bacterium]|nr:rhamnulokinase [Clostridiales bacterium]